MIGSGWTAISVAVKLAGALLRHHHLLTIMEGRAMGMVGGVAISVLCCHTTGWGGSMLGLCFGTSPDVGFFSMLPL